VRQEESDIEKEFNPDIDKFKGWLKKLGITHIVSYDDEWDKVESGTYTDSINRYLEVDIDEFAERYGIEIDDDVQELLDENEVETVEELMNDDWENDLANLKSSIKDVFGVRKIIKPLEILENILGDISKETDIIFQKHNKPNYEEISKIEGRILFLIDMNMQSVGLAEDSVIDVIRLLKKNRAEHFDLAIVYSHEDLGRYKQHDSKVAYIEDYLKEHPEALKEDRKEITEAQYKYLLAYQLWGINKTHSKTDLIKELVEAIEKAAFGYSLHDYLESKILFTQRAATELINLSEEKFNILLQDSFIEGERFLDILNRTHESISRGIEFDQIQQDTNYREIMKNVMSVARAKDAILLEKIGNQSIVRFSRKEIFERITKGSNSKVAKFNLVDYGVNELYENITTGDIFEIKLHEDGATQYAILISASCDLPLRFQDKIDSEIDRKKESIVLSFYNGKCIEEMPIDKQKQMIASDDSIWPIVLEDGKSYALSATNKICTLNGKILDLCTFTSTGEAILEKEILAMAIPYKNYHSLKYMEETLYPWLDDVKKIESYLGDSVGNELMKEKDLLPILAGLKYNIKMNYEESKFEIKRIGRLEKAVALNVVQNNMTNLSRIGLEKTPLR
jgi:hypothetical protein